MTKQVALTTDRQGNRIAYRWSPMQGRWFRVGFAAAEFDIATGTATQVTYRPQHVFGCACHACVAAAVKM